MSSFTLRVLERTDDGGVLRFTCVDDGDPSIYTSASTGATPPSGSGVTGISSTMLHVLQIPLLRETDDAPGLYVACGSAQETWGGCALFRSIDGGTTFTELMQITRRATLGAATTILANWQGGNTVDPGMVEVQLYGAGELESITHDAMMSGGNLCLIGDELVQWKTALLIAPLRYRLTGLLRGRLGTEEHIIGHTVGERFVLIDEAVTHVDSPISLLGRESTYRAVSLGNPVTDGADETGTETQTLLLPLAPIDLKVSSTGSAYVATWKRRTRIPSQLVNGGDAPMGEATERYRFTVRGQSGATDVDMEVTTTSATFGNGTSYSGYFGLVATLSVQQISDRIGVGAAATLDI